MIIEIANGELIIEIANGERTIVIHIPWQLIVVAPLVVGLFAAPFFKALDYFELAVVWALTASFVSWILCWGFVYYGLFIAFFLVPALAFVVMPFSGFSCVLGLEFVAPCKGVAAIWWSAWVVVAGFISSYIGARMRLDKLRSEFKKKHPGKVP